MCLPLSSFSSASFFSKTRGENYRTSTNSFMQVKRTYPLRGSKRRAIEMSRGHEPEEHLDPRLPSNGREPNNNEAPKTDDVRARATEHTSPFTGAERHRAASR